MIYRVPQQQQRRPKQYYESTVNNLFYFFLLKGNKKLFVEYLVKVFEESLCFFSHFHNEYPVKTNKEISKGTQK